MGYRLIKGEFHLFYQGETRRSGSRPDGDSCWFKPNKKARFKGIDTEEPGRRVEFNKGGMAQLRFEAIDALEVHFQGTHQEMGLAKRARDETMENAGFSSVVFGGSDETTAQSATPHPVPGYVLTRKVDPNRRPVCFVFAGKTNEGDGKDVFLDTTRVKKSLNAKLMAAGHAYPSYYTGLPTDLRKQFSSLANGAKGKGLGPKDTTKSGLKVTGAASLETSVIWPKLFRRLADFVKTKRPISQFPAWLEEDSDRNDRMWIVSRAELGNLTDAIAVKNGKVRMVLDPSDLIIVPR